MKTLRLHRRAVLKGLGGITLGLPLLEVMLDSQKAFAQSAMPATRYLVFFDGQSLGADNDTRHNDFVPNTVGRNYDLKSALAPLADYGDVRQEVSVVSGLRIPTAHDNGGAVPSAGRPDDFHVSSASPLLSGVRSQSSSASGVRGPSSDQVMLGVIAGSTPFQSLVYRVQAEWYLSVSAPYGRDLISYKTDSTGRVVPVPAQTSPRAAFQALFGNFTPPMDPNAAARFDFEQRSRRSVLDLVRGDTERLLPKLGAADRQRLQRHLDELRDLERRVAAIPPPTTSVCMKPGDPGADPAIGGNQGTDAGGNNTYAQNLGYSGEDERARLFCDLIHMAMACDLTRVASLQMTMFQSHLNMYPITGQATDCHELGHGGVPGGTLAMSRTIAWHVKHFAYLLSRFRDTPEGNGRMIDNLAAVFLLEGGHGYDPGGQKDNSSHSTENMAVLVAGRAGGLRPGQHVVATGRHPVNAVLSAMRGAGYQGDTLGEVTGHLPELFRDPA